MKITPKDQADRIRAARTFDQNIVVTAGAGTGKTTLLIQRLLHLLMRGTAAIPITAVIALTFTNKSANEMKIRLREALEDAMADEGTSETVVDLMNLYGLCKSDLDTRATAALQDLERSEIGTIHHFATTLLRLYPIEADVDPKFRIDEGGDFFQLLFESSWRTWLRSELSVDAARKDCWESVLEQSSLKELETLARSFVSEPLHFSNFLEKKQGDKIPFSIVEWLKSLENTAIFLLEIHPEGRKIETLLSAARTCFSSIISQEVAALSESETHLLQNGKASIVKGWDADEFKTAQNLIKIAQQVLQVNETQVQVLCKLLKPFVALFHEKSRQEAWVSFDALLIKARDLLRDHPSVREDLKQRFRAILIDEFQDTDPVQYEILLYLAEDKGQIASNWQKVKLAPGKLFVVGDPKQSIYGFRRADIEAYHAVRALIFEQGGLHCTLSTNFRSHNLILDVVNGVFEKVMIQKAGIQPEYIAIHAPNLNPQMENSVLKFRAVSLRLIRNKQEKWTAETAKQMEGEAIALWLSQEVLGKALIPGEAGEPRAVKKGDVAILMRTLTGVQHILQPLRHLGIAYWVEGEKHFYRKQVVIDAVNLLRVVADVNDKIALVAVLRSPVGGFDDNVIYKLEKKGLLNYGRSSEVLDASVSPLYALFSRLHDLAAQRPVAEAINIIFDECAIRLFAAASNDGAQALANLEKIEEEAKVHSKDATMTFKAVVSVLQKAVAAEEEAAESSLAEAGIDAVKVFSIHKAKGLEFPLVILAGAHAGANPRERASASLRHDWSSDLTGLRLGEIRDLNSIFLKEKVRLREIEEEKRLLYVAMTRAREHLMISAAPNEKIQSGSFLSHIETALGETLSNRVNETGFKKISIGQGLIASRVLSDLKFEGVAQVSEGRPTAQVDTAALAQKWKKRFTVYDALQNKRVFISPTQLKSTDEVAFRRVPIKKKMHSQTPMADSAKLGQLAHRFLEGWDFSSDLKNYKEALVSFLNQQKLVNKGITQEVLFEQMHAIFKVFFFSPAYEALTRVKIIGREVPFIMPWKGQVMRGEIDLIYEEKGALYIADYKTDRIKKTEIQEAAKKYHHQGQIYPEALRRSLKREVMGMKVIFLRLGLSVQASPD